MKYIRNFKVAFTDFYKKRNVYQDIKIDDIYFHYKNYKDNISDYESIFADKNFKLKLKNNDKNILCKLIYDYSKNINKRYSIGEKFLIDNGSPEWCVHYAKFIIKSPWTEAENKIYSKVTTAYKYSLMFKLDSNQVVIKKLNKSSLYSYKYAKYIIKGRFLENENIIFKNSKYSFYYFRDILKKNWIGNEDIKNIIEDKISSDFLFIKKYLLCFKRKFNKVKIENFSDILKRDFEPIYKKISNSEIKYLSQFFHFKK
jgi:hypothetical protein